VSYYRGYRFTVEFEKVAEVGVWKATVFRKSGDVAVEMYRTEGITAFLSVKANIDANFMHPQKASLSGRAVIPAPIINLNAEGVRVINTGRYNPRCSGAWVGNWDVGLLSTLVGEDC
jgi:hypothetical protein